MITVLLGNMQLGLKKAVPPPQRGLGPSSGWMRNLGTQNIPPTLRGPLSSLRGKRLEDPSSFLPVHPLSPQIFIVVQ